MEGRNLRFLPSVFFGVVQRQSLPKLSDTAN